MTLRQLSQLANVSISTVSKALNNADDVAEGTRARVLELAQAHGYTKHLHTAAAPSRQGLVIAVLYSDITSNYYTTLLKVFDDYITEQGGLMVSSSARFSTQRIIQLCEFYAASGMVDGIVCISPFNIFGELPQPALPMVGISYPSYESHPFDYVCVDDDVGIDDAIRCLRELGHTRIGYLGEPYTWYRQQSFEKAMRRYGLQVEESFVTVSKHRFELAGHDGARVLLAQDELPTAVFAAYDDLAVGAAQVFNDAGLRIPEDISIAGVDNTMRTLRDKQVLASVNCHIEDQVEITLGLLLKKIENPQFTAIQNVNLRTEFVCRSTVGPPPPAKR